MKKELLIPMIILLFGSACEKNPPPSPPSLSPPLSTLPPSVVNTPPTSYAGGNIGVFLPVDSASLSGLATDAENNIVSYKWRQLSGPSQAIIQTPDSLKTKISKLIKGEYSFELKVTDSGNLSGTDTTNIVVFDAAGTNVLNFKGLYAGCWGGECLLSIDGALVPRDIPVRFFLKFEDASVWMEVYPFYSENRWFIQFGGGDLEESKNWEVKVVF